MSPAQAVTTRQAEIMLRLAEVVAKVDQSLKVSQESLEQSRENSTALTLLAAKLGVDGEHGRIPLLEAASLRCELRAERLEARVVILEKEDQQQTGRDKFKAVTLTLLTGSAGAAVIALISHMMGH